MAQEITFNNISNFVLSVLNHIDSEAVKIPPSVPQKYLKYPTDFFLCKGITVEFSFNHLTFTYLLKYRCNDIERGVVFTQESMYNHLGFEIAEKIYLEFKKFWLEIHNFPNFDRKLFGHQSLQ